MSYIDEQESQERGLDMDYDKWCEAIFWPNSELQSRSGSQDSRWPSPLPYDVYRSERRRVREEHSTARQQQLYEGNYLTWQAKMRLLLRKQGLEGYMTHELLVGVSNVPAYPNEIDQQDMRTVDELLKHVDPVFLARQPIKRPVGCHELLKKLQAGAKSFRFFDLPYELRCHVWRLCVPVGREYEDELQYRRSTTEIDDSTTWACGVQRPYMVHTLCAVCKEFRGEVSKVHYRENIFVVDAPIMSFTGP